MVTNIKGFLLTFSSSRFESCEEVSKTGKVQAAFTCEQVVRVYNNKWECTKCYVFGWFSAVLFRNEDSSYNQRQLGLVNNGQQL